MSSATKGGKEAAEMKVSDSNIHWALGKAGEDRVHVVGGLFVGIYDGFNSPYAPEFLMGNLYKDFYNELEGLLWDNENNTPQELQNLTSENTLIAENSNRLVQSTSQEIDGLLIKKKDNKKLFPWRFGLEGEEKPKVEENRVEEERNRGIEEVGTGGRRKVGPIDHGLVLRAMPRALEITELAYLDMTEKVLDRYPKLALMGS
ncbi:unnamed protein product [Ilex paraguariensis]|uniref:Uncharacterized protein n=1 Tax=Ilex paraguariensis TaxID=185542 RepID=A0ABC8TIC1_9AQUA